MELETLGNILIALAIICGVLNITLAVMRFISAGKDDNEEKIVFYMVTIRIDDELHDYELVRTEDEAKDIISKYEKEKWYSSAKLSYHKEEL